MPSVVVSGISFGFPRLSRCEGQIAHVLLTRSPLVYPRRGLTARLACVKHAASVRPEPGSNSPLKSICQPQPQKAWKTDYIERSFESETKPITGLSSVKISKESEHRQQTTTHQKPSKKAPGRQSSEAQARG